MTTMETEKPFVEQLNELAEADTGVLVGKIAKRALLVDLTVKQWEGRHKIEGAVTTLGGKSLPAALTGQGYWVLRPKEWAERFSQMAGIMRGFMHPKVQPVRGIDVISLKDAPRIFASIRKYRQEVWEPAVEEFALAWPALAAKIHPDLLAHYSRPEMGLTAAEAKEAADGIYKQLVKHIPTAAGVRERFGIEIPIIPLGSTIPSPEDLVHGDDAEEFLQDMEAGSKNFVHSVFMGIIEQPLEEAAAVAESIVSKVQECKGGLREESMGVMKRALEKLSSLSDFVARPKLLEAIEKAQAQLAAHTHEDFNVALRNKGLIGDALGKVFKSIGDEVHLAQAEVKKYGRKFRSIEM